MSFIDSSEAYFKQDAMEHGSCAVPTGRALVSDKEQDDEEGLHEPERRPVRQPRMLQQASQSLACGIEGVLTLKTVALSAAWILVAVSSAWSFFVRMRAQPKVIVLQMRGAPGGSPIISSTASRVALTSCSSKSSRWRKLYSVEISLDQR
jgi:hypothetical protein